MIRENNLTGTGVDQLVREAALRRRVRALNQHVLGDPPDKSRPDSAPVALWLGLLCGLVLVVWAGLVFDPHPTGLPVERPGDLPIDRLPARAIEGLDQ